MDVKKVKDLIIQHFPDTPSAPSSDDGLKWLESVLENLKMQLVSNNQSNHNSSSSTTSSSNANHLNNNGSDVDKNNLNNNSNTLNGDSTNFTSADNEIILLQNAQLKTTVDEYKNIIAETVSIFNSSLYFLLYTQV